MGLFTKAKGTGRKPGFNSSPKGFVSAPPPAPPTPSVAPVTSLPKQFDTEPKASIRDILMAECLKKVAEVKKDKARQEYIKSFYSRKISYEESMRDLEGQHILERANNKKLSKQDGLLYLVASGGEGKPASQEIKELLDFANVVQYNPEHSYKSILGALQPRKLNFQRSYAVTLYGDFHDSVPEKNDELMFKEIGTFASVKPAQNSKTGEYGVIVGQEYGKTEDDDEHFIPNKKISIVAYEV